VAKYRENMMNTMASACLIDTVYKRNTK